MSRPTSPRGPQPHASQRASARAQIAAIEADPYAHADGTGHRPMGPRDCPPCAVKRAAWVTEQSERNRAAALLREKKRRDARRG